MPKAIWKGAITFGLITIPVGLYSAIEEKSFRFNQLHDKDKGRIRYKRTCSACGEEVSYDEIVKGYEFEKGNYAVFTEEELQQIPADSVKAIDVVAFVPLEEIDPVYFQKPYYLAPEPTGLKAYKLLEQAMTDSGRIGIAKITLRDKEHLATLRARDGVFILETMHWPDEIRQPEFEELSKNPEIRKQELDMARNLIENLSDSFNPESFVDNYRERLAAAVQAKVEGMEVAVAPTKEPTQIVDLMEALKASVEATKKKAGEDADSKKGSEKGSQKARSA
ncbi:MAG: Ku protein [Actinobacteria bacterium]|nr:Ku protein [Actinomycetota bacterium]